MNRDDKGPSGGFPRRQSLKLSSVMPMVIPKQMTKQNIPVEISLAHAPHYLVARSEASFTYEKAMEVFNTVLAAVAKTGCRGILLDATALKEPTLSSSKLMLAMEAHDHLTVFRRTYGHCPRIAVWVQPPFGEVEDPVNDYMRQVGLPFRLFLSRESAVEWLEAQRGDAGKESLK